MPVGPEPGFAAEAAHSHIVAPGFPFVVGLRQRYSLQVRPFAVLRQEHCC